MQRHRSCPGAARFLALALTLTLHTSCACSADPTAPPPEDRPTIAFDDERAWADLEKIVAFGPRVSGSRHAESLREFLAAELRAAGLDPVVESFEDTTPIGKLDFANVYADLPGAVGKDGPPPMIILGTHFDTKRLEFEFQGANDGGSGTAVLLELARQLAAQTKPRAVTYRFLFLDGEEAVRPHWADPDNRYGSRYHAQQLRNAGAAENIGAFVLLDMVGDRDLQFFEDSYSDLALRKIFSAAARGIGLGKHFGGRREPVKDDHLSFLAIDVPSIDLIDLDYGPNNSYWHTRDDTLEHVAIESLDATGKIVLAALPELERFALGR